METLRANHTAMDCTFPMEPCASSMIACLGALTREATQEFSTNSSKPLFTTAVIYCLQHTRDCEEGATWKVTQTSASSSSPTGHEPVNRRRSSRPLSCGATATLSLDQSKHFSSSSQQGRNLRKSALERFVGAACTAKTRPSMQPAFHCRFAALAL